MHAGRSRERLSCGLKSRAFASEAPVVTFREHDTSETLLHMLSAQRKNISKAICRGALGAASKKFKKTEVVADEVRLNLMRS